MSTKILKFPMKILITLVCMFASFTTVLAVYDEEVEAIVPVSVEVTGEKPSKEETYKIHIVPVGQDWPEAQAVEIKGSNSAEFSFTGFEVPGVYDFTVYQDKGTDTLGHYDETVYYVRVSITNKENSAELESTVAVHKSADMKDEKVDKIVFTNKYDKKPEEKKTADTADNSNVLLYGSITIVAVVIAMSTILLRKKNN